MKGTKGDNCKFADDGTLWHKGQDLDCIRKKATEGIETIVACIQTLELKKVLSTLFWFLIDFSSQTF
jgi:hypothetical protein